MHLLLLRQFRQLGCLFLMAAAAASALLPVGCATSLDKMQTVAHGRPRGVEAAANGSRSVRLKWSLPYDKIYRYWIERATAEEGPYMRVAIVSPEKLGYVDGDSPETRLADSTTYYYRIIALLDTNGPKSEPSDPVAVLTAPPPAAPAALRAAASSSRAVTLSWEASASEGVVAYRVERATAAAPAFEPVATVKTPACVDGGTPASTLKDSTRYLYRVVALNAVESESAPSDLVEVVTLPPPATVKGLAAVSREVRCVPLTWQASGEADIVRYDIYVSRDPGGPFTKAGSVEGQAANAFTAGGGNPGTLEDEGIYYFTVRAVNTVTAESADCEAVRAVTREVPPEVRQVAAVSARPREVPLSWAASPDTAVMGYEVWRATGEDEDWAQIVRLAGRETTSYLDRGGEKLDTNLGLLKDGTAYQYKVVAYNTANVRSSASVPVQAKTKVIPATPQGLTVSTNTAHTVRLAWQPNPEKDIVGYRIESSKKAENGFRPLTYVAVSNGAALVAEETPLDPGEIRFYRVRAVDAERLESEWCPPLQGRSKPLPDAPTALVAQADGATAFALTWQAPAQTDIVEYRVWSKKLLFGWERVAATQQPEYRLELPPDAKPPTLAVTAVDRDQLESEKSEPVKPLKP
jgi:fibronectin type 3 domain-containing protein